MNDFLSMCTDSCCSCSQVMFVRCSFHIYIYSSVLQMEHDKRYILWFIFSHGNTFLGWNLGQCKTFTFMFSEFKIIVLLKFSSADIEIFSCSFSLRFAASIYPCTVIRRLVSADEQQIHSMMLQHLLHREDAGFWSVASIKFAQHM